MINREDMLELTRRMNVSRNCFSRVAGAYVDGEGFIDNTFNVDFRDLKVSEKKRNLALAKEIPFAESNRELKEFVFSKGGMGKDSIHRLLLGLAQYGLQNDAVVNILCDELSQSIKINGEYGIYLFHGRYDIPLKGTDNEQQGESEEVYDFLILAAARVTKDYDPENAECGFLFPAFKDRSGDPLRINIFDRHPDSPQNAFRKRVLGG